MLEEKDPLALKHAQTTLNSVLRAAQSLFAPKIQKLLGHSQITSTMVYLHLTHQTSQDALRLVDELCQGLPT